MEVEMAFAKVAQICKSLRYWVLSAALLASISVAHASTPSTTTLSPNPSTAYRTAPNNTVVLTSTVSAGATGTVTFNDGSTTLTCSEGAQPRALSGNQAVCTTTFSSEGIHVLSAAYSGDATFASSSGLANVFIQNHATNLGTTYCNSGAITNNGRSDLAFSNTAPYPSVIFVGDGVNTDIANSVHTVSLSLKNFSSNGMQAMHLLLVAPDQTHAFDFWSNVGTFASAGNYTLTDGATQLPNSVISPGTYGPTADGTPPDAFTPAAPAPALQPPASFQSALPQGSSTFLSSFVGATSHGAWSLFLYNASGATATTNAAGGWCLTITPSTGFPITVSETANPMTAQLGGAVTFTATILSPSHPAPNEGTVTFTENGSPLVGTPNNGVTNVINGVASIATSALSIGDHTVKASYHDSTNTYEDNFGTVQMRVNAIPPTLSKAFGASSLALGGTTSLTFAIDNPSTSTTLTGVGFSDTLPSGLAISTPNGLSGDCGGGTITATQNTIVITLSGATLAASAGCTFSVNVSATGAGTKVNTTGAIRSNESGPGGTAAASLTVNKSSTTTTLTTRCETTFVANQSFTMDASTTGHSPTGSSTFYDGGVPITGCVSVGFSSGAANCVTSSLPVGTLNLTATYSGDVNNLTSNSGSLFVSVLAPSDTVFRNGFEAVIAGCPGE
jgi:Bacterial Ig-like domain (group 3)